MGQIGSLVLDVGGRCISAIAKVTGSCREFVKMCFIIVKDNLEINYNKNKCGRKKNYRKVSSIKRRY